MAGTGIEQTGFRAGKQRVASSCHSIPADRIELFTRAVILAAGMNLAEAERAAVLTRVIADMPSPTPRIPQQSSRAGEVPDRYPHTSLPAEVAPMCVAAGSPCCRWNAMRR